MSTPKFDVQKFIQDCKTDSAYNALKTQVKSLNPNEAEKVKTQISTFLSKVQQGNAAPQLKKQIQQLPEETKEKLIQAIKADLTGQSYGATGPTSRSGSQDYGRGDTSSRSDTSRGGKNR